MAQPNFENRTLFHGDNLEFLRGMDSETIDLIATDPPFNKNRDFHASPDSLAAGASFQDRWSWRDDLHDDWLEDIQRDHPEVWQVITAAKEVYGDDMGAYLCWLGVRLLEMHRILKPTGSIYVHIDHTAFAWVKCLLDAIFGGRQFRDAVIWSRAAENLSRSKWRRGYETILYYAKGQGFVFNRLFHPHDEEYIHRTYRFEDEHGRYTTTSCTNNAPRPNMIYEFNGNVRQWRFSRDTMERYASEGRLVYNEAGVPRLKKYLHETPGVPMTDVWADIEVLASNANERTGYPTQKPLALYERIVQASSNPGDWVLDPFCGCATTPVAAEKLGRKWVGMDIWDEAHNIVLQRMEDNRQLLEEPDPQIHYRTDAPIRTDNGEPAVLVLQTPTGRQRQRYPAPRTQHDNLIVDLGPFCQGCGRDYSFDPRVLEVDHMLPKTDGGTDAYGNLTLLCPPCNKEKRDRLTLTGLQAANRQSGQLTEDRESNLSLGRGTSRRGRGRRRR